jgi:O-antigen/teichoic acid export membrane protein
MTGLAKLSRLMIAFANLSRLRRNIVANYLGQGWAAVIGIAFIPVYIRYLGVEAYGLIGFFAVIQTWLAVLDAGLTPTLQREMARFTAGAHSVQSICNLLRSIEVLCLGVAAAAGMAVWAASGFLAESWLNAETIPVSVVAQATSVMALVIALRFGESVYRGALLGLQHHVWLNTVTAAIATLRYGGAAVIVAWISPTVGAFFLWQAVVSIISVAALALSVRHFIPRPPGRARFTLAALTPTWKFSLGTLGISFLGLLLTQVDKVLLSRMLSLELFGYYTLAILMAGVSSMLVTPLMQSTYPRFIEFATRDDEVGAARFYHRNAQLVANLAAPLAAVLCFFSEGLVYAWSGDVALASSVAPILSVVVLGVFLNQMLLPAHNLLLAHGRTRLLVGFLAVAVCLLVPTMLWVVSRFGVMGAAWTTVVLYAGYVVVVIQLMHRDLLPREKWKWFGWDFLLPASGAFAAAWAMTALEPAPHADRLLWIGFLMLSGGVALLGSTLLSNQIWAGIAQWRTAART